MSLTNDIWSPIAASGDLPFRHVFHGQLLGQEFAAWRADDGHVNVWENRCLHRGVRLSIGLNDGRELVCQYHGWRYANRTAGCTYIPAHPADAPARTITNRTYPVVERYGLIWTTLGEERGPPARPELDSGDLLTLREMAANAPAAMAVAALRRHGDDGGQEGDGLSVTLTTPEGTRAAFFVQPVDSGRCVIRGVLAGDRSPDSIATLRLHNERLKALRDVIEAEALAAPAPEPLAPVYAPVSAELAEMPGLLKAGRRASLSVAVSRKWAAGADVAGFELAAVSGGLPTFQPGGHIDVHLPNGLIRPYSLVNAPGETGSYVIGVKRDPASRGGSQTLHETVREGDLLAISEPRNNFPLRRDANLTIFIAGGVGVTPLIAMAQALDHSGSAIAFHCFARDEAHIAFADRLGALKSRFTPHLGLDPVETEARLRTLLGQRPVGAHVYLCGPTPMLETARRVAAEAGWPEAAVHFEYFKNERAVDAGSSFEIALARSALTLTVPAGRTILEVLRDNGVDLPSSCEQGACGTCEATVLEGEPDHQDVYLSDAEKREGRRIMTCVSRARSARITLDV
ncbi:2Fe-2S iron-sulfur cluster-binding protein [Hansschlegelia quercus]|uniref:2Fe-2S iron-sulfur cluster binding domain-containing protein n=1 Tax=Hansschlegelia quercus TaxID=2528245 RepID=A0A4Q9GLV7_9HYPH|nr:2Fe-2S iron-sulfur cluster-binding protein [Hansschlegelia quercus]TBN55252.1 2Fe-2S iron-sulfur cluster binding domain-containing protein [Hansschlegelia quercus]